jgi:hypothetical protein
MSLKTTDPEEIQIHTRNVPAQIDEFFGLDPLNFDRVLHARGVPLIHYRAMLCPCGLSDPDDLRRPNSDHSGCDNGFIYQEQGIVTATLTSNQSKLKKLNIGIVDDSTHLATFSHYYDSVPNREVYIRPFDRLYYTQEDLWTSANQLTKRRLDGRPDRVEFEVLQVEALIDADNVSYQQSIHFDIVGGDIQWREDEGPEKGVPYSIMYLYRPYYYVSRMLHSLRLFPSHGEDDSGIVMSKIGMQCVVEREFVHRTNMPDVLAPDPQRRQHLPVDVVPV